jgi:hypothetical protein
MNYLRFVLIELLVVLMFLSCSSTSVKQDPVKPMNIEKFNITLDDVAGYVNECLLLLEQPIPDGFKSIANNVYQAIDDNDYRILICTNNKVIATSFNAAFSKRTNATHLNALFHTFFANNNWEPLEALNDSDAMYTNAGTYAAIDIKQEMRDDGYIVTYVCFTKNYSFFSENFIQKD